MSISVSNRSNSDVPRAKKRDESESKSKETTSQSSDNKPRAKKREVADTNETDKKVVVRARAKKVEKGDTVEISSKSSDNKPRAKKIGEDTETAEMTTQELLDKATTNSPRAKKMSSSISEYLDEKLGEGFSAAVERVAKSVGADAKDLVAVMAAESGLNPNAGNGKTAVGLFQFTKAAADHFGTSLSEISNMSAIEQLNFAENTLSESKRIAGFDDDHKLSLGDIYAANFLPAAATDDVLAEAGGKYSWAYNSNSGLDLNRDGQIVKDELVQHAEKLIRQNSNGFSQLYFSC